MYLQRPWQQNGWHDSVFQYLCRSQACSQSGREFFACHAPVATMQMLNVRGNLQVTVDGESLITMPGSLAKYYKELGGQVQLMGKPDPIIYTAARKLLHNDPQTWLAIGDSLEHDIAG